MLQDDWKNRVMYQILPRVFKDSNGDGIGDLAGIVEKLDYLKDLGISGIWLMPFYRTHGADEGYDVEDYYKIRRQYGDENDLQTLINECHKRDIKIIIDLVLNHTSNVHKWFLDDCLKKNKSRKTSYYMWEKENPHWGLPYDWKIADFESWNINPWHDDGYHYYSAFSKTQPDLNFDNPKVFDEVVAIVKYYLNMGIDGFRMDAIRYLIEEGKGLQADTESTHLFWQKLKKIVAQYDNRMFMGECFEHKGLVKQYVSDKEFDTCVNFSFAYALRETLLCESPGPLKECIGYIRDHFPSHLPDSPFAVNHDEVNHRFATLFNNYLPKMKAAMALLILSPGIPYLYYGEEIGMTGKADGLRRDLRKIMQWDETNFAGFSSLKNIAKGTDLDTYIENCIHGVLLDENGDLRFWMIKDDHTDQLYVAGTFNQFQFDKNIPLNKAQGNLYLSKPFILNSDMFEDDYFKFYICNSENGTCSWLEINIHEINSLSSLPDSNIYYIPQYNSYNYQIRFQSTGFKRPFLLDRTYKSNNVASQRDDTGSYFNFIKNLLNLKKRIPALDYDADFQFLDSAWNNEKLFAFKRTKSESEVIVVVNLKNERCFTKFTENDLPDNYQNVLAGNAKTGGGSFEMRPYEIKILEKVVL